MDRRPPLAQQLVLRGPGPAAALRGVLVSRRVPGQVQPLPGLEDAGRWGPLERRLEQEQRRARLEPVPDAGRLPPGAVLRALARLELVPERGGAQWGQKQAQKRVQQRVQQPVLLWARRPVL